MSALRQFTPCCRFAGWQTIRTTRSKSLHRRSRGLLQLLTLFRQRAGDVEDAEQVGVGHHGGAKPIGLSRDVVRSEPAGGGSKMIRDSGDAGKVLSFQRSGDLRKIFADGFGVG